MSSWRRWSPRREGHALVTGLDDQGHGAVEVDRRPIEFRKFLTAIDKAVPAGLDVHLVCDNYATHTTADIRT